MTYRDVITSHLKEDTRILTSMLAVRRVYSSFLHDVFLCVYSGLMGSRSLGDDLITCLVVFKDEKLRIMIKLWTAEIRGDRNVYLAAAVERLKSEGKGPLHLVRDSKLWTRQEFTLRDRAALRMADIHLPRPPKGENRPENDRQE
jgi:hypothetical protein